MLEKSLRVLKPGGQLISNSGPPDLAFARSIGASWVLRTIMGVLSYGIVAKAKRRQAEYSFLFMRANGDQLTENTSLIDDGIIRPVVDRVFPFASTKEAMGRTRKGQGRRVTEVNETRLVITGLGPSPGGRIPNPQAYVGIRHFKAFLPIRTTSLVSTLRTTASERPSRDQSKLRICSAWNSVRRLGSLPSSGWSQMSATPPGLFA